VAQAAAVAVETVARFLKERNEAPIEVRFVLFDQGTFDAYAHASTRSGAEAPVAAPTAFA